MPMNTGIVKKRSPLAVDWCKDRGFVKGLHLYFEFKSEIVK